MSSFQRITFSMVLLLTIVSVASAQRGRGVGSVSPIELASAADVQAEIELNDDQKEAVDELLQSYRSERRELFQGQRDASREERTEKMQELSNKTDGKLKDLLEDAQAMRLGQIYIQVNGVQAVNHPLVSKALEISDEQKEQLSGVARDTMAAMREAFQEARESDSREQMRELFAKFREEMSGNMLAKLTDEQKEKLESLKGEAFEFDRSQLRRRGRNRQN